MIKETIDFDNAVGIALDFAEKNDNTLVIVTADHETGGASLTGGSVKEKSVSNMNFSTDSHSATVFYET